jgi:hypothetical protein
VLVRHVVEAARHALGEAQRVELPQQRIAQGELALEAARREEERFGGVAGAEGGEPGAQAGDRGGGVRRVFAVEAGANRERFGGAGAPVDRLGRHVGRRPVGEAALIGRTVERQVALGGVRGEHLHLVEVQAVFPRHHQAHKAGARARQVHHQRLAVGDAAEDRPGVAIHGAEGAAVVRELHLEARRAIGGLAAVPDDHAPHRLARAEVDLPPGIVRVARVEAPFAVLHPVAAAGGVGLRGDRHVDGGAHRRPPRRGASRPRRAGPTLRPVRRLRGSDRARRRSHPTPQPGGARSGRNTWRKWGGRRAGAGRQSGVPAAGVERRRLPGSRTTRCALGSWARCETAGAAVQAPDPGPEAELVRGKRRITASCAFRGRRGAGGGRIFSRKHTRDCPGRQAGAEAACYRPEPSPMAPAGNPHRLAFTPPLRQPCFPP